MAIRTIARMYDSYADASAAVRELEAAGFSHDDVSLVGHGGEAAPATESTAGGTAAGTGATLGTLVGGGAGLLAGLGSLAIPGVGPIVAAGWLVATLAGAGVGAAAGGLLGALTGAGVSEEEANVYAEGVRRGGNLVTVRAEEARAPEAERILAGHNPVDVGARRGEYEAAGWSRYDEAGTPPGGAPVAGTGMPSSGTMAAGGVGTTTAAAAMGTRTAGHARTDAALGRQPDGTPGNPPGTAASRTAEGALGTNMSGTRPENEWRHSGVGHGGLQDDARDGTPENPPGTQASRAVDDALGTNVSGARPEHERDRARGAPPDGTPGNPPGTKASRAVDDSLGTNVSGARPENETRDPASGTTPGTRDRRR